jgi:mono/diheme cytochrome c family protein
MSLPIVIAVITAALCFATSSTMAQSTPADNFKAKCMMCHAADGSGNTPAGKAMGAPPFQTPALLKATDADLIAITKSGKGKMPAFAGKLPDDQIKDLIKYVRTLQKK